MSVIGRILKVFVDLFSDETEIEEPSWGIFNPPFDNGCVDIRGFGKDVQYVADSYTEVHSFITFSGTKSTDGTIYLVRGDTVQFNSDKE